MDPKPFKGDAPALHPATVLGPITHSRGAPPAPPESTGLESFCIRVPSPDEQSRIAERLKAAGFPGVFDNGRVSVRDPWNIGIEILAAK